MKRIIAMIVLTLLALKAGTVTFAGKTLETATYAGRESVTLREFASKTGSKQGWVAEKKKGVLVYNSHTYVFTANNRTVIIDNNSGIYLVEPVGWDGTNLYIPVRMLERIFNAAPSQVTPSEEIKIEKIILSGSDPTTIQIVASGQVSCEVIENSATSVTLKLSSGSNVKEITPYGLVSAATLRNNNNRTTIDLKLSKESNVSSRAIPSGIEVTFESKGAEAVVTQPKASKKLVIVIDPGHGGKDPGAIGTRGTKEAAMTLDTALKLKKLLEAQGHTVHITRSADQYVPLADRTKFANQKKADLFISVHFNANNSSVPNGFETYFLGTHRLEYAKDVALKENASLKYDLGEKAYNPDAVLNDIIATLLTNKFQRQSEELAGYIQDASSSKTGFSNRGLNQAGFYVLKGCSMPAILIEAGFLTNSKEEAKIRQPEYRQKIAEGIASGVSKYIGSL